MSRTGPQLATLHRMHPRTDTLKAERAEHLKQLVLSFDLPDEPVRQIVAALDRQTAIETNWVFVMISPAANAAVVRHLLEHAKRPKVSVGVWSLCFTRLRHDTGEIVASQAELAAELGVTRQEVSAALSELVRINALTKWRVGRETRFGINPNVGTSLAGQQRVLAQQKAGPLRLVS
jgi:hypothetical protein